MDEYTVEIVIRHRGEIVLRDATAHGATLEGAIEDAEGNLGDILEEGI